MKDLIHRPVANNDSYECERCGVEIPTQFVLQAGGADVVDIAGLHETFLPMEASAPGASISCSHPAAEKQVELLESIHETDDVIQLADEQEKGNKPARPVSDMERMVTRAAYGNFWAMRDSTRPEGYNGS